MVNTLCLLFSTDFNGLFCMKWKCSLFISKVEAASMWANLLNFDRRAKTGATWSVLVIHYIKERNSMKSGLKPAFILIGINKYLWILDVLGFFPKLLTFSFLVPKLEKCCIHVVLELLEIWMSNSENTREHQKIFQNHST